jgi:hypothetical protein
MKTLKQPARLFRSGLLALALAAVLGGAAAAPALADDWHHGRDFRAHEWRGPVRHDHDYYRPYAYAPPAYRYAPPPAAYGAPGVNLVVPLDIR